MSGGLYSLEKKEYNQKLDLTRIKPYGDTLNDGKVQVSFTLPLPLNDRSTEAAKKMAEKMGLDHPHVAYTKTLSDEYAFFIVYGSLVHTVDYTSIEISDKEEEVFSLQETDTFIDHEIGRKIVVIGASTGTDAHTVGIDAIMNMKGYAGHYGLERYDMFETYNLGSQIENVDFIQKAVELKAEVLLVSQTVTQKNVHISNLTELIELLEAEGLRQKMILICGGPRVNNELAKELGYDAGFGPNKFADNVATFIVKEMVNRQKRARGK
ncbi:MAG: cobalamin-dependent protein [Anaerolineaceae bacterium]|nr:cobalamin-dependent protein [Anaerolineaceae bacterium]